MAASEPLSLDIEAEDYPPLPPIRSAGILDLVFTHRSYFARPRNVFEDHPDDPSPDNERLEHLGDTVLALAVTHLLMDYYPYLRVGPSTKIRSLVVSNTTLASISRKYDLPCRLCLHPGQAVTLRASVHIQADLFEAYIGGLYRDSNWDTVKAWLTRLFLPYIAAMYKRICAEQGVEPQQKTIPSAPHSPMDISARRPPTPQAVLKTPATVGHLALFNQQIVKGNTVKWDYSEMFNKGINITPVWVVSILVNGEVYGRGCGNKKKMARDEAAKEALRKLGIPLGITSE